MTDENSPDISGTESKLSERLAGSRREFMGTTAKLGGSAAALSALGAGSAAADAGAGARGGSDAMTGLTTKTNGKLPGTGGFEEFGDRRFLVKENPEGGIPQHVKVACGDGERTKYRVYQIFFDGDEPMERRESYLLVDDQIETGRMYEFVGDARECPGSEKPPFEFLQIQFNPVESDDETEAVSDIDILNYALTLERLEATFYTEAVDRFDELEDFERDGTPGGEAFEAPPLQYGTYGYIKDVRNHEQAHVDALVTTIEDLGGDPVSGLEFEFPYETPEEFVSLAYTFENVGVTAYAGVAPMVDNPDLLGAAASILGVEARHASYFATLGGGEHLPWKFGAFDRRRSMETVKQMVSPFIVSE